MNEDPFENEMILSSLLLDVLMHKEAHFGGLFPLMIETYEKEKKGAVLDVPLQTLLELNAFEKEQGTHLAATYLSGSDAEKVGKAKEAYKALREVYETKESPLTMRLLSDLILSESEDSLEEIEAIVYEGEKMVKPLIELLQNDLYKDPLYPGYGDAPRLAATCLGEIGDPRAIEPLFLQIGRGDLDFEETIFRALKNLGKEARDFLLKMLRAKPITKDNEKAITALCSFEESEEITDLCLTLLKDQKLYGNETFVLYLIAGLTHKSASRKKEVDELMSDPLFPSKCKEELSLVTKSWA